MIRSGLHPRSSFCRSSGLHAMVHGVHGAPHAHYLNNSLAACLQVPKAELHLHIEGTLEPGMMLALAKVGAAVLQCLRLHAPLASPCAHATSASMMYASYPRTHAWLMASSYIYVYMCFVPTHPRMAKCSLLCTPTCYVQRNHLPAPYPSEEAAREAYNFQDLQV